MSRMASGMAVWYSSVGVDSVGVGVGKQVSKQVVMAQEGPTRAGSTRAVS